MKANFIIGKKQIILASLVVILGAAVYLNWNFANTNDNLDLTNTLDNEYEETGVLEDDVPLDDVTAPQDDVKSTRTDGENPVVDETAVTDNDVTEEQTGESDTKHLGDTLLVNAKTVADDTYFAKARLARTKSRDEAIATITTILDDEKLTETDKQTATDKAMALSDIIELESRVENLVKAKGFAECMVYVGDNNVSVVVKSTGLDQNQATQIKNIIVTECNVKGENVSISEIQ